METDLSADPYACERDNVQLTAYKPRRDGANGFANHMFDRGSETTPDIVIENADAVAPLSATTCTLAPAEEPDHHVSEVGKIVAYQLHTHDGDKTELKYKVWLRGKIVGLSVVTVIVWCLLLLPVVIFYIPGPVEIKRINNSMSTINNSVSGSACIPYTRPNCQEELNTLSRCFLGGDANDFTHVVTKSRLDDAEQILPYVDFIATPECSAEVKPFLCLYFFGLCDVATGMTYKPSASQCRNIRDDICMQEWNTATAFGLVLPDCDVEFTAEEMPCVEDTSSSASGSGVPPFPDVPPETEQGQPMQSCSNITCSDGFYCDDGLNICTPLCGTWSPYSKSENIAINFSVILSTCIGVLGGIGVLIVAGIRWKKVFVFPSILVVYQSVTLLVLGSVCYLLYIPNAFFVVVTYIDNTALYCTSQNLFKSLTQSTGFCVIAGAVLYYSLFQLMVLWLCHILTIFWGLKFPFQAKAFQRSHRMKYLHIASVVVGLLVPFVPVVATMIQFSYGKSSAEAVKGGLGFGIVRFPPILCVGRHKDTTFYSLILPLCIILLIGITFLIFVFWIIHKQRGLFHARQLKNIYKLGTAERKILIVSVYYIFLSVLALLTYSQATRDTEPFISELLSYFECERRGVNQNMPCDTSGFERFNSSFAIILSVISFILIGLYPVLNLIFVIDFQELKNLLKRRLPRLFKPTNNKSSKSQDYVLSSNQNATALVDNTS